MLGKIFAVLCISSVAASVFNGTFSDLSGGLVRGCSLAAELAMSMCGMMCFWSGMMRVLEKIGAVKVLSRILSPLLRFAFPGMRKNRAGIEDIAVSFSANALGLSNGATPIALRVMKKLKEQNPLSDVAGNDMMNFVVTSTVPFCVFPSTVIALRTAAGSSDPFGIMLPVWICSFVSFLFAAVLCRILGAGKVKKKVNKDILYKRKEF